MNFFMNHFVSDFHHTKAEQPEDVAKPMSPNGTQSNPVNEVTSQQELNGHVIGFQNSYNRREPLPHHGAESVFGMSEV